MSYLLLAWILAIVIYFTRKRCVSEAGFELNHIALFTFGYLFYWIMPIALGLLAKSYMAEVPDGWSELFNPGKNVDKYLLACGVLYLCYAAGDTVGLRVFRPKRRPVIRLSNLILISVRIVGCVLAVYSAWVVRHDLLGKYTLEAQSARGTVTAYVFLLWVGVLFVVAAEDGTPFWRRFLRPHAWPFLLGSAFLIYIASRLYVASFICMAGVYGSCFGRKLRLGRLVLAIAGLAFVFGTIGALRVGLSPLDSVSILLYESLLGSLALVFYLRYGALDWFNVPHYLGNDFLYLVPTLFWPNKHAVLVEGPQTLYNPHGGYHTFVTFNMYFGLIGTAVFMFALGLFFRYLRTASSGTLCRVMYTLLSGCLIFTFFRDPFAVSLVKVMFENSIVIPCGLVLLNAALPGITRTNISALSARLAAPINRPVV